MSKATAHRRIRQQENAVNEQPKLESPSSFVRRTRHRENADDELRKLESPSSIVRRNRNRENAVDEQPKLESSSTSVRRSRRRENAVDEQPKLLESSSSARRTLQRNTVVDKQSKLLETPSSMRCTRQRQGDAIEQQTVESLKRKRSAGSETANSFPEEAVGAVACDGQSSSLKKTKTPAPKALNKLEEGERKVLDLQKEHEKNVGEDRLSEESVVNSFNKKKGDSAKKVSKKEQESIIRFLGDPVPMNEAKMTWPERYTKKVISNPKGVFDNGFSKDLDI